MGAQQYGAQSKYWPNVNGFRFNAALIDGQCQVTCKELATGKRWQVWISLPFYSMKLQGNKQFDALAAELSGGYATIVKPKNDGGNLTVRYGDSMEYTMPMQRY